jgi:hypothetical protein
MKVKFIYCMNTMIHEKSGDIYLHIFYQYYKLLVRSIIIIRHFSVMVKESGIFFPIYIYEFCPQKDLARLLCRRVLSQH